MAQKKIIFVVLDGVGIGALPDAPAYGDAAANTLANVARAVGGLNLPNLERMGLGNIAPLEGVRPSAQAAGCYGRMAEQSAGKDSTTGHWEIAGLITERPFPLYPSGFPDDLLRAFLKATGVKGFLGNKPASGTHIIAELGDEHRRTEYPILYTSGDSVFQIAAHEDVIPLEELYLMCGIAREKVLVGEHRVGRVIARPFIGTSGAYERTGNRRDYSVAPPAATVLNLLLERNIPTIGIGKIDDLFAGQGLQEKLHTKSNEEGIETIIRVSNSHPSGLILANLVDFDMLYGHLQDPKGFAAALEAFDVALPRIVECLRDDDLLVLTADHGNDPTDDSTDHTREFVPLLTYGKRGKSGADLGTRKTFADAGKTVADFFDVNRHDLAGHSVLDLIVN